MWPLTEAISINNVKSSWEILSFSLSLSFNRKPWLLFSLSVFDSNTATDINSCCNLPLALTSRDYEEDGRERIIYLNVLAPTFYFSEDIKGCIGSELYSTSEIWPLYISFFSSWGFDETENKTRNAWNHILRCGEKNNSKALTRQNRSDLIKFEPKSHSITSIVFPDVTANTMRLCWTVCSNLSLWMPCLHFWESHLQWPDISQHEFYIHSSVLLWLKEVPFRKQNKNKPCKIKFMLLNAFSSSFFNGSPRVWITFGKQC